MYLNPKAYAQAFGLRCPACGVAQVKLRGQIEDHGHETVIRECSCGVCPATWTETFLLTGYDNLEIPEYK